MRTSTRNIVSAVGLSTLAMSYVVGMNSDTATGIDASELVSEDTATSTPETSATGTTPSPTANPGETAGATQKPSSAPSASSTKISGSTSSGTTSSSGSSGTVAQTKSGSLIEYRYGAVQISVTKLSGKITKIDLLTATASDGHEIAFSPLVQAAMAAQGTSFGNLTNATLTTEAFKQALDSALSKF